MNFATLLDQRIVMELACPFDRSMNGSDQRWMLKITIRQQILVNESDQKVDA